ncbi:hypothetical protein JW859_13495 [bacterium]|nr:hypothetical protein [bacterium]
MRRGRFGRVTVKPAVNIPRPRPYRRPPYLALLLAATAIAVGGCLVWGGYALAARVTPERVVVRGCWMTDTLAVLDAIGFNGLQDVGELRRGVAALDFSEQRWLRGIKISQDDINTTVLTVDERCPLLFVQAPDRNYWLCDDRALVVFSERLDVGEQFDKVQALPVVKPRAADLRQVQLAADTLLATAAGCREVLPGQVGHIILLPDGQLELVLKTGFRIQLGEPVELEVKLGALPTALRICQEDNPDLDCLDARNPQKFYESAKEPINY